MTLPNIRPAVADDVPEIVDLVRDLAIYEKEPDAVQLTPERLHEHLFGEHAAIYAHVVPASEHDPHRIDGFALWFLNFSTWEGEHGIYLEDLYVRPDRRGRGLGKALLQFLATTAVERGYRRVEWAVLDWNEPSIQFYRSLGAGPMNGWSTFRLDGDALQALGAG